MLITACKVSWSVRYAVVITFLDCTEENANHP
jgi:hypothetical protein